MPVHASNNHQAKAIGKASDPVVFGLAGSATCMKYLSTTGAVGLRILMFSRIINSEWINEKDAEIGG
jgi:hypothetical protein